MALQGIGWVREGGAAGSSRINFKELKKGKNSRLGFELFLISFHRSVPPQAPGCTQAPVGLLSSCPPFALRN